MSWLQRADAHRKPGFPRLGKNLSDRFLQSRDALLASMKLCLRNPYNFMLVFALTFGFSPFPYLGQRSLQVIGDRAPFLGCLLRKPTFELGGNTQIQRFSLCHRRRIKSTTCDANQALP
jgi:hypothetical protein